MTEPAFDPAANGWTPLDSIGYAALVGPIWQRPEGDAILYGLLATPAHVNRNGTVHGGVTLGLADHALGHLSLRTTGGLKQATVQLDTQFIAAAHAGDFLVARGTVVRRTRALMFMRGEITVRARVIATASGLWKILGER